MLRAGGHETNLVVQPIVSNVFAVAGLKVVALTVVALLLAHFDPPERSTSTRLPPAGMSLQGWNTVVLAQL